METTPLVHSVLHATRLLELYAAQRKESLSLTEISQALGLHKTTVYRCCAPSSTPAGLSSPPKAAATGWAPGYSWWPPPYPSTIPPGKSSAKRCTGWPTSSTKPWSCPSSWAIRASAPTWPNPGTPWAWPGNGATWFPGPGCFRQDPLAAQPPELRDSIIQEIGGDRTQQRLLKNQLLHILQTGYCISEGEVDPGIAAVAVPLVMKDRIYALSISGPLERLKALGYTQLADGLLLAAQRLEQKSALLSD